MIRSNIYLHLLVLISLFLLSGRISYGQDLNNEDAVSYTLFIAVKKPYKENRLFLLNEFKQAGYDFYTEGDFEIVLLLSKTQLNKLFKAKLRTITSGSSSGDHEISYQILESYTIPKRYKKYIESIYFDPQRS